LAAGKQSLTRRFMDGQRAGPNTSEWDALTCEWQVTRRTQGRVRRRMLISEAIDLVRQALLLAMIVSAPMLLIGLAVGIFVSLLQAVTQIQEQTLTFIPKIAAMIAAALVFMPWIGQHLLEYPTRVFSFGAMH